MSAIGRGAASSFVFIVLECSSLTGSAIAAELPPTKSFAIVRIAEAEAPVIDGRIDEATWQRAAVISDFRQFQPNNDADASERTEFYVMYDEDTLYIGARLWDSEPDRITAAILRQGERLDNEDKVSVILDTFNDKRNGYRFEVNPNGVRDDALYLDTTQLQWEWEGIYAARATRDAEGWTAEMAIPFKTLSFDPANDRWGINFSRFLARKNERTGWVFRNRNQTPSSSGLVTGLTGMNQGLGLDAIPGVSFRQEKNHAAGTDGFSIEPSLDVYYKVTPGLNASLTFNTDFSATEADARQVNLSRFSLFYPEKRAFFLRESDIFEFGRIKGGNVPATINPTFSRPTMENGRPFFSRRIGLGSDGEPVDLIAGGKLSGRIGGFNVGALAIRQDQQESVDARNLFVARGVANVLDESSLGVIATSGDPRSNLDNSLVGADFRYTNNRLASGRMLEGELWYQQSSTEGLTGDDAAYGLRLRSPNNTGLYGGAGMKELQANFNPALGYVNRKDIRTYTGELGYTFRYRTGYIQAARAGVDVEQFNNLTSGKLETQTVTYRLAEVFSRRNDQVKFFHIANREVLTRPFEISPGIVIPAGDYSFGENQLELEAAGSRFLSGNITGSQGDFYDGQRLKLRGDVVWKASSHFWFTGSYEYNDVELPEGDFIVRLASTRFDLMFTDTWSWVTLVQYDNVSDSVAGQTRLRYIPQAGREMYIVFNHNLLDENEDGTFTSTKADATAKFNYTFRF